MAYQVLARKYRPQRFSDVIGQDHVTRTLGHALEQNRIAHGYIFSGHRGIGKTTIARILAMALNCRRTIGSPERPTYEPCAACESCEEVRAGNAVDVIEIDAATNRGIDEIRELRDAARYRPARDRYKIYILDEAHQITDAAFNALLKTLEEPPDHVVFMMATTQPEDILQTIRSRCQHFSFHAVRFDAILAQLEKIATDEHVLAESEALALLAEAGDGSMRDALSIMDQAIASAPVENGEPRLSAAEIRELMGSMPNAVFARLLESVSENNSAAVLSELDRLLAAGNSPSQIARQLVRYLRNVLMARIAGEGTDLLQISPDERARAAASALLFGEDELTRFLQVMLRTFDELNYRQEARFHLELGVLKLVHLQRLLPVEELLSQLAGSPSKPAAAASSLPGTRPAAAPSPLPSAIPSRGEPVRPQPPAPAPAVRSAQAPPETQPPSFSPFERDAQRKSPPAARSTQPPEDRPANRQASSLGKADSAAAVADQTASTPTASLAEPVEPHAPALAAASTTLKPSPTQGRTLAQNGTPAPTPSEPPTPKPIPQPAIPSPSTEPQATHQPTPELEGPLDLQALRDAAASALSSAGHTTAATLLAAGTWTDTPEGIRVELAAKEVMLGLTMNAEADKLARSAMRPFLGQPPRPVQWIPAGGSATAASKATERPAPSGSMEALALENPLVQQAKSLFQAEVRSVVDLRNKR